MESKPQATAAATATARATASHPTKSRRLLMPMVANGSLPVGAAMASAVCPTPARPSDADAMSMVSGELKKWHPLTVSFSGPMSGEMDEDPNPFLDYRLQVIFVGPSGQAYNVPGFYAGDGQGGGAGTVWQARFAPDEAGEWRYCASFRSGPDVAVALPLVVGTPAAFDGTGGSFIVGELDPAAPGFLKWGRLEYADAHYLKFRDGPYWIKGGTNSPENFLGYQGFDNTFDQGGIVPNFLHAYAVHQADWQSGDPLFASADTRVDARGIIGALNYLAQQQVNSIYFLPMNLGGDGQESYPFVGASGTPFDNTHYDISKLYQWNLVLEHAQRQGIALHVVLNEREEPNRTWLDEGTLGVERRLFYREMAARFGYLLALKWNLSEENALPLEQVEAFADYLQAQDWAGHPITIHTSPNAFHDYEQMLGAPRFTATAIQYSGEQAGRLVEQWRALSHASGRPWVIDMDENNPAAVGLTPDNADQLRKTILYDVYFSGGNIEWYAGYHDLPVGGDMRLEDFRTREAMWEMMWYARRFMEEHLPFWEMQPADHLLEDEADNYSGEVFAKEGEIYAIYLPNAAISSRLAVGDAAGPFLVSWYNPRTGQFEGEATRVIASNSYLSLGNAPAEAEEDWVILVTTS